MATCALCGGTFEESELLFHDRGRICEGCELDLEERGHVQRDLWATILSGPLIAAAASALICVPILGVIAMVVGGGMALWRGTTALRVAWYGRNDPDLGATERAALWASGGLTTLWSIALLLGGLVGALWMLVDAVT